MIKLLNRIMIAIPVINLILFAIDVVTGFYLGIYLLGIFVFISIIQFILLIFSKPEEETQEYLNEKMIFYIIFGLYTITIITGVSIFSNIN